LLRFIGKYDGLEFVSILRNGRVSPVYDAQFFLGLSKNVQALFDSERPGSTETSTLSSARRLHFRIDANIIYLFEYPGRGLDSITAAAFFLDSSGSDTVPQFRPGGRMYHAGAVGPSGGFATLPPGIAALATFTLHQPEFGASGGIQKDERLLKDLTAFDLRKDEENHQAWSLATSGTSAAKDCLNRTAPSFVDARSDACVFRYQDRSASGFILIDVPPKQSNSVEGAEDVFGTLVAVDVETKRAVDIDIRKLIESARGVALGPNLSSRRPGDFRGLSIGGTYNSIVLAVPNGKVIDVFRFEGGQPRFVGTYTASAMDGQIFFTLDGQTMVRISGSAARIWDISQSITSRIAGFAKDNSASGLVKLICGSDLPKTPDKDTWRIWTGLDTAPINPCGN
jgi:hypothetical protein